MAFVIITLYSVLLGTLFRNFVVVQVPSSAGAAATVHQLIRADLWYRTVGLLLLFFIDWVCFMFVFPPAQPFAMELADLALLMCYVPAVSLLGFAVVLSLDTTRRFCVALTGYHACAAIAELLWLSLKVAQESLGNSQTGILFLAMGFYLMIRIALAAFFYVARRDDAPLVPDTLIAISLVPKPALLILLYAISGNVIAT
ncbi:MAG TPA: hypothetical protein VF584_26080 [Longimicrobium sp.]|jgi:hypothetical protein